MRTQLLKAKINQKLEKEESIKRELETKKERDRLERIHRREERAKKVAENKAALLKKANEKKKKIEEEVYIIIEYILMSLFKGNCSQDNCQRS